MKKLLFLILLFPMWQFGHSQSLDLPTISSSGKLLLASNGTIVNLSIGEVCTETLSNKDIMLSSGFNQYFLIDTWTHSQDKNLINVSIYPNPTAAYLAVDVPDSKQDLQIHIYSKNGRIQTKQPITSATFQMNLSHLVSGTYILQVRNKDGKILAQKKINKI